VAVSIGRRSIIASTVAAVVAAVDKRWPDDWPWRDRERERVIRDSMYAELLGAFKALIEDFREYRRTHPD
jgi:hypothetical protein